MKMRIKTVAAAVFVTELITTETHTSDLSGRQHHPVTYLGFLKRVARVEHPRREGGGCEMGFLPKKQVAEGGNMRNIALVGRLRT